MRADEYVEMTVYTLLPEFDDYMAAAMENARQLHADYPDMAEPKEERVAVDVLGDFGRLPDDTALFGDWNGLVARLVEKHYHPETRYRYS